MFRNVATKIAVFAFTTTDGTPKTGDAANLTAYVSKDYGAVTVLADITATELDATNAKGWYLFDVAQAESNADALIFSGKSATANISVVAQYIHTAPNRFTTMVIDAAGLVDANMVKAGPTGSGAAVAAGAIPNAVAGTAGGLFIAGSNAATTYAALTVTGATTLTGNMLLSDGLTINASTGNRSGINVTGNGTGSGLLLTGGATGNAFSLVGGATSGNGLNVTTTDGHGVSVTATGTSKHGLVATGGNLGTSDGIKGVAGTGGVDIRAGITGNITGNLSGSVGSVTGLTPANLDVAVSTRASQASVDLIKAKTDNLPAAPAAVGDIPTATQNADALLNRDMSAVSDINARSPLNALRFLRNLWSISGTTLTVKKEDDITTAWTSVVTPAPGADPISGSDPA